MNAGTKCKGVLGAIFGHKWRKQRLDAVEFFDPPMCFRCGLVPDVTR